MRARSSELSAYALLLGICGLVSIIYMPGLDGGYVFDDFPNIVHNQALHLNKGSSLGQWIAAAWSSPSPDLPRPLAMLSFAINHAFTGINPYWMKATNLIIHLINTCLVFALTRTIYSLAPHPSAHSETQRDAVALAVTAAWALNTIHVTAVLLVVQRMEGLSHLFVFTGLWLYTLGRRRVLKAGRGWGTSLLGIMLATFVGLLAKESALLLPLYAFLLEVYLLKFSSQRGENDKRVFWGWLIPLSASAIAALVWILPKVAHPDAFAHRDFSVYERVLTEARVLIDYLRWTILPELGQMSLYHDDYRISTSLTDWSVLLAITIASLAIMSAVVLGRRRPLFSLGVTWFFAAHLITGTILPLELVFEHRNYFASYGAIIALTDLLRVVATRASVHSAITIAAALCAVHAGSTTLRVREWKDPMTFAISEAQKKPNSPRATYESARQLVIALNHEPDGPLSAQAWDALERSMRVPNASALTEATAIIHAYRTGRSVNPKWWLGLQGKLSAGLPGPQAVAAVESLIDCSLSGICHDAHQEIIDICLAGLENGPHPGILHAYGNYALNGLGDAALTRQLWQEAAHIAPKQSQYQESLIKLLISLGELDAAQTRIDALESADKLRRHASTIESLNGRLKEARESTNSATSNTVDTPTEAAAKSPSLAPN